MLDLSNFLRLNPQFVQLGSASAILSVINAKSIDKVNGEEQSFRQLVLEFGIDFTNRILAALDKAAQSNPILKATYFAVCTTGLDFSNPQVREQIDQLVPVGLWTQEDAEKIKQLGMYKISPVEDFFGKGQVADLAAVNTALVVVGRLTLLQQVSDKYNQMANMIRSGSISTMDEAKTLFNS
jgi:hypothetical protein